MFGAGRIVLEVLRRCGLDWKEWFDWVDWVDRWGWSGSLWE